MQENNFHQSTKQPETPEIIYLETANRLKPLFASVYIIIIKILYYDNSETPCICFASFMILNYTNND